LSRWRSKFCIISPREVSCGGPEGLNAQTHREQDPNSLCADLTPIIFLMFALWTDYFPVASIIPQRLGALASGLAQAFSPALLQLLQPTEELSRPPQWELARNVFFCFSSQPLLWLRAT
jgi:hypothetical protein